MFFVMILVVGYAHPVVLESAGTPCRAIRNMSSVTPEETVCK